VNILHQTRKVVAIVGISIHHTLFRLILHSEAYAGEVTLLYIVNNEIFHKSYSSDNCMENSLISVTLRGAHMPRSPGVPECRRNIHLQSSISL
jgi:hypothetical protein